MRWLGYPIYRLLLVLILGIITSSYFTLTAWQLLAGCSILILIWLALTVLLKKYNPAVMLIKSLALLTAFYFIGVSITVIHDDTSKPNHFLNYINYGTQSVLKIQLEEQLSSNAFNDRFYGTIAQVGNKLTTGRTVVLFKKSDSLHYQIGDEVLIYDDINRPSHDRNPGDFNYKRYLELIKVYGQVYVDLDNTISYNSSTIKPGLFKEWRSNLIEKLNQSELTNDVRSIIEALLLGQRKNVSESIITNFRNAGVIHILALSGLHVGIILLILEFLTRPMLRLKYGNWIRAAFLIACLWSFALLTGMSPSILRAVTMFSFVAIGMNVNRKSSVYHALAISALVLLLFNPNLIYMVGFQLSYTAVLAIVLIQPMLSRFWRPRYWIFRYLWSAVTVTVAAQLGVAALSIFYFHQFPGAFIIGNFLLLPFLPVIIGAAILLIVGLLIGVELGWFTTAVNWTLQLYIDIISEIASWEQFILKDLYIDAFTLTAIYVVLIGLGLFFSKWSYRSKREVYIKSRPNYGLHLALTAAAVLTLWHSFKLISNNDDNLLVLHQASGSAVAYSNSQNAILYRDFTKMDSMRSINSLSRLSKTDVLRSRKIALERLAFKMDVDSIPFYTVSDAATITLIEPNAIILLSNSVQLNLERLIINCKPKVIISDGSNYRSVVNRWQATCDQYNIKFINTYETGAVDLRKI